MCFAGIKMVLMSQASPSHGIRTEILLCKSSVNNTSAFRPRISTITFPWDSSSKSSQKMHHVDAIGVKSKRGNQVIVAASPPTEDAVVATDPLTKEDLVGYLASGCKPKENWRFLLICLLC